MASWIMPIRTLAIALTALVMSEASPRAQVFLDVALYSQEQILPLFVPGDLNRDRKEDVDGNEL